jgi:hypothetical protein
LKTAATKKFALSGEGSNLSGLAEATEMEKLLLNLMKEEEQIKDNKKEAKGKKEVMQKQMYQFETDILEPTSSETTRSTLSAAEALSEMSSPDHSDVPPFKKKKTVSSETGNDQVLSEILEQQHAKAAIAREKLLNDKLKIELEVIKEENRKEEQARKDARDAKQQEYMDRMLKMLENKL